MGPLSLTINMVPIPKGRPRFSIHGTYTPENTSLAEEEIRIRWRIAHPEPFPAGVPLSLKIQVFLTRPKAVKRPYPSVRPDLDNYLKLVMDALNRVAYPDDGQIVRLVARKMYAEEGTPPCLQITLWETIE